MWIHISRLDHKTVINFLHRLCKDAVTLQTRGAMCLLFLNLLVPAEQYDDFNIPKTRSILDLVDLKYLEKNNSKYLL